MKKTLSILFLLALLLSGCSGRRPKDVELTILYTSDMSHDMLPINVYTGEFSDVSLASFVSMLNEQSRITRRDYCMALDLGNKIHSGALSFYCNYVDTVTQHLVFRTNRHVGYEALGLGEKDFKREGYLDLLVRHPELADNYLCANLVHLENLEPVFKPYRIYDRNGIIIAVMGMTAPQELVGEDMMHYEIIDMVECAQRWMPEIQSYHPDLVIGLFSCGIDYEQYGRTAETYLNPAGGLPAAIFVPGFDVILSHEARGFRSASVTDIEGNEVPYYALGSNSEHAAVIRIRMHRKDDQYQKRIIGSSADLSHYKPDTTYLQTFAGIADTIRQWFTAPLGYMADTIYGARGMYGPDAYSSLLHKVQSLNGLADMTITSCMLGKDTFPAGTISMRRIFQLYPFENELEYIQLSGEEVQRALEWMAGRQYDQIIPGERPHIFSYVRNKEGEVNYQNDGKPILKYPYVSYSAITGIDYTIDLTRPSGNRVRILGMSNGERFDPNHLYIVALNSFLARDGHKFVTEGLRWDIDKLNYRLQTGHKQSLRFIMAQLFQSLDGDTVHLDDAAHNWSLLPQDFCKAQIKHEMDLVNGN